MGIEEMVTNLASEQKGDDSKKEYCNSQLDKSEDTKKQHQNSISDSETAIEEMQGSIQELTEEIAALVAGVKALDKSVAEATELRKNENADFTELKTSDTTAKEVLMWAKNRLNKFYDPKMYKPPAERQMTEEERITVNEENAQSEYEAMMQDASAKRAADSKSITQKSAEKASTEEALQAEQDRKGNTATELMN